MWSFDFGKWNEVGSITAMKTIAITRRKFAYVIQFDFSLVWQFPHVTRKLLLEVTYCQKPQSGTEQCGQSLTTPMGLFFISSGGIAELTHSSNSYFGPVALSLSKTTQYGHLFDAHEGNSYPRLVKMPRIMLERYFNDIEHSIRQI